MGADRYRPIRDYAAIGDCHGSALVARDARIDWCWLGRFDANPVFCGLLDADQGGYFAIRPRDDAFATRRAYHDNTTLLTTRFATAGGEVSIIDFMPVGRKPGAGVHDYVSLNAPGWLVRIVEGVRGSVDLDVHYAPSVDFARRPTRLSHAGEGIAAGGGAVLYSDYPLDIVDGRQARATLRVAAGERRFFVVSAKPLARAPTAAQVLRLLAVSRHFWEEWIGYC
nr:DUF5911 domain-containing protein [Pseudomonadota bacterium]